MKHSKEPDYTSWFIMALFLAVPTVGIAIVLILLYYFLAMQWKRSGGQELPQDFFSVAMGALATGGVMTTTFFAIANPSVGKKAKDVHTKRKERLKRQEALRMRRVRNQRDVNRRNYFATSRAAQG